MNDYDVSGPGKIMGFVDEFKEFAMKGNVLDKPAASGRAAFGDPLLWRALGVQQANVVRLPRPPTHKK